MDIIEIIELYKKAPKEIKACAEQILAEGQQHPDIPLEHSQIVQQMLLSLNLR